MNMDEGSGAIADSPRDEIIPRDVKKWIGVSCWGSCLEFLWYTDLLVVNQLDRFSRDASVLDPLCDEKSRVESHGMMLRVYTNLLSTLLQRTGRGVDRLALISSPSFSADSRSISAIPLNCRDLQNMMRRLSPWPTYFDFFSSFSQADSLASNSGSKDIRLVYVRESAITEEEEVDDEEQFQLDNCRVSSDEVEGEVIQALVYQGRRLGGNRCVVANDHFPVLKPYTHGDADPVFGKVPYTASTAAQFANDARTEGAGVTGFASFEPEKMKMKRAPSAASLDIHRNVQNDPKQTSNEHASKPGSNNVMVCSRTPFSKVTHGKALLSAIAYYEVSIHPPRVPPSAAAQSRRFQEDNPPCVAIGLGYPSPVARHPMDSAKSGIYRDSNVFHPRGGGTVSTSTVGDNNPKKRSNPLTNNNPYQTNMVVLPTHAVDEDDRRLAPSVRRSILHNSNVDEDDVDEDHYEEMEGEESSGSDDSDLYEEEGEYEEYFDYAAHGFISSDEEEEEEDEEEEEEEDEEEEDSVLGDIDLLGMEDSAALQDTINLQSHLSHLVSSMSSGAQPAAAGGAFDATPSPQELQEEMEIMGMAMNGGIDGEEEELYEFGLRSTMPGWTPQSFGYHSDDGHVYHVDPESPNQDVKSAPARYGVGDVVGCGIIYPPLYFFSDSDAGSSEGLRACRENRYEIRKAKEGKRRPIHDPVNGQIFFTKNGVVVHVYNLSDTFGTKNASYTTPLFPTVGLDSYYPVSFNFGHDTQKPFSFDVLSFEQNLFADSRSSMHNGRAFWGEATSIPTPSASLRKGGMYRNDEDGEDGEEAVDELGLGDDSRGYYSCLDEFCFPAQRTREDYYDICEPPDSHDVPGDASRLMNVKCKVDGWVRTLAMDKLYGVANTLPLLKNPNPVVASRGTHYDLRCYLASQIDGDCWVDGLIERLNKGNPDTYLEFGKLTETGKREEEEEEGEGEFDSSRQHPEKMCMSTRTRRTSCSELGDKSNSNAKICAGGEAGRSV